MRAVRAPWLWLIVVVVIGIVFYFTWQSIERGQRTGTWSYSHLFTEADAGRVATVEISGQVAVATAKDGSQHVVTLSPDEPGDARRLEADGVDVVFRQASGTYWLQVLVPNVILLLLIAGFVVWVVRRSTRR